MLSMLSRRYRSRGRWDPRVLCAGLGLLTLFAAAGVFFVPPQEAQALGKELARELDGGTGWLGTDHPLTLKGLRGKIVILEFWTEC
jgi:hypothetical protein